MGDPIYIRMRMRKDRLSTTLSNARTVLEEFNQNGVTEGEAYRAKISLKLCMEACQKELDYFTTNSRDDGEEVVQEVMTVLMDAEELLTEFMILSELQKNNTEPRSEASVKLPKIDLPSYDGNVLKFTEFWDRFQSIIDSKRLANADKLAYLRSSLTGEAEQALAGLLNTNDNYDIAVDKLQKRFGKKNVAIDAHYAAIRALTRAETTHDCRVNLDKLETHLRVLSTLGEDPNSNQLRSVIREKFPERVLYQVNLIQPGDHTVSQLRTSLDTVVTALENSGHQDVKVKELAEGDPASAVALQAVGISSKATKRKARSETMNGPTERKRKYKPEQPQSHKQKPNTEDTKNKQLCKVVCIFCKANHFNDSCDVVTTMKERKEKLKGHCYLCLSTKHMVKDCKGEGLCVYCNKKHNRALCPTKVKGEITDSCTSFPSVCLVSNNKTYLQTAIVLAAGNQNNIPCRTLLDCGSQRSYITTRLATKLGLKPQGEDPLLIFTFGSDKPRETISKYTDVDIETRRGIRRKIRVNIVPHITDKVPRAPSQEHFKVDLIADDNSLGETVEMLIGNDHYFSFIRNTPRQVKDNMFIVDTDFGWIPTGSINDDDNDDPFIVTTYCQCHEPMCPYLTEPDLPLRDTDIKFLWTLESIGINDSPKASRDEEAVKHFNETILYQDHRYQVKWPWIEYPPALPTNYGLAYGRLKGLIKRLDRETLEDYDAIIKEQLDAGVIEIVDNQLETNNASLVHYMPHHIVKQEGKRGRIVYDGSAKLKDQRSLNECLYKGPSMLEDLTSLLLKFRTNKFGIIADVEKAFLQIGLQNEDRNVTRFLWMKDIKKGFSDENIIHIRFQRVPFGVISSPFLLTATVRHHLLKKEDPVLRQLSDRIYVDNLILGADTTEEALQLYQKTRDTFQELSMNVREWTSNNSGFVQQVQPEHRHDDKKQVKLLGLIWNLEEDTLTLKLNNAIFDTEKINEVVTKKQVLRTVASFYDPCGFAAPLIVPMKMLLQELWKRKIKWTECVPEDLLGEWKNSMKLLLTASEITIPRYLCVTTQSGNYSLHCFTDASKKSYSSVIYLRSIQNDDTSVMLVMSKLRVTPIQDKEDLKIPRLELLGFTIGNRLLKYVKENIGLHIEKLYLWTDSLIVLSWMKTNRLLPPFVSRRVAEIKLHGGVTWNYVPSQLNPADIATRPELWPEKKDLWFEGPGFLHGSEDTWPKAPATDQETICAAAEALDCNSPGKDDNDVQTEPEESEELQASNTQPTTSNSNVYKIINGQKTHFPIEMAGKETSLSRSLKTFKDVDGILRCQGRMTHTDWSYDKKYPILLPKDAEFTREIIMETHARNLHVGANHTLSLIRQRYWIPQGRDRVRRALKNCEKCVKHGGGPYKLPPTPALPPERVNYSTPFTFTGMDYFGPIFVYVNGIKEKRWICLYTCLAVRAIHLEVVKSLTATECLLALRRFVSSRNTPNMILSDNAPQFKLTSEILSNPYCKERQIRWRFIPQLAPWHGGVYERLVGVVKHCLRRTLEKHLLTDSELNTAIKEVEAVVNTRPLTYVGSEPDNILSPSDFLSLGRCLLLEPLESNDGLSNPKRILIEGWKRGQRILEEFKDMFQNQYLLSLREKYQSSHKEPRIKSDKQPEIGDVVQMKGELKNRETWRVGKISQLIRGLDGACRVAIVKVGDKEFRRSIHHLYPLEMDEHLNRNEWKMDPAATNTQDPHGETSASTQIPLSKPADPVADITMVDPNDDIPMELDGDDSSPSYFLNDDEETKESPYNQDFEQEEPETPGIGNETPDIPIEERPKRQAAIKARQKIAEMTRQLLAILFLPRGQCRDYRDIHTNKM